MPQYLYLDASVWSAAGWLAVQILHRYQLLISQYFSFVLFFNFFLFCFSFLFSRCCSLVSVLIYGFFVIIRSLFRFHLRLSRPVSALVGWGIAFFEPLLLLMMSFFPIVPETCQYVFECVQFCESAMCACVCMTTKNIFLTLIHSFDKITILNAFRITEPHLFRITF